MQIQVTDEFLSGLDLVSRCVKSGNDPQFSTIMMWQKGNELVMEGLSPNVGAKVSINVSEEDNWQLFVNVNALKFVIGLNAGNLLIIEEKDDKYLVKVGGHEASFLLNRVNEFNFVYL